MTTRLTPLVIGGVLLVGAQVATAKFQINGFASFGGNVTDAPHVVTGLSQDPLKSSMISIYDLQLYELDDIINYKQDQEVILQGMGARPNFDQDTGLGIQIAKNLTDDFSFMAQFVSVGNYNNYEMQTSWLLAKYQITPEWVGRVGRFRAPAYMFSDDLDVRYAYPWIRPPMEVYAQVPFSNMAGIDLNFTGQLAGNKLTVQGFAGSANPNVNFNGQDVTLQVRDMRGLNLTYGNEALSGRVVYADARFTFKPQLQATSMFRAILYELYKSNDEQSFNNIKNAIPTSYWNFDNTYGSFKGIGYKLDWNNLYSLGELVHRKITGLQADQVGGYVLLGYRFGELMPHFTYSQLRTLDNKVRRLQSTWGFPPLNNAIHDDFIENGLNASLSEAQHSFTTGLRYDAFAGTVFKAEWQLVKTDNSTSGLFSANPGKSVNILSLGVDIVF